MKMKLSDYLKTGADINSVTQMFTMHPDVRQGLKIEKISKSDKVNNYGETLYDVVYVGGSTFTYHPMWIQIIIDEN